MSINRLICSHLSIKKLNSKKIKKLKIFKMRRYMHQCQLHKFEKEMPLLLRYWLEKYQRNKYKKLNKWKEDQSECIKSNIKNKTRISNLLR